jgi:3-oxoacyl-[acyl-carrier protein] reductase
MFPIELAAQHAIVTGSSTGIGRAIAAAFAKAGADVAVHYTKNLAEVEHTAALVRECGRKAIVVRGDFRRPAEVEHAMREAVAGLGGSVDILVNNAGDLIRRVPFDSYEPSLWDDVIALNLSSVFHAIRVVLPHFAPGARIVNVSSLAALDGGGAHAFAYAAAKGGVVSMTRSLAKEFAPRGIRVNCIAPGLVQTPFHDRFNTPERLEAVRQSLPLRRLGLPEDIAGAALYLVSQLSSFVTGEVMEVNGGGHFG